MATMASLEQRLEDLQLDEEEIEAGSKVVDRFLESLLKELRTDPLFGDSEVRQINTGSYYEGVKVSNPSEYDFLFVFDIPITVQKMKDDRYVLAQPADVTLGEGHLETFLSKASTAQTVLDPVKFKKKFYDVVCRLVIKVEHSISVTVGPPTSGPNIMIKIVTSDRTYDVDLVPALKTSFPEHAKLPVWLVDEEKQKLRELGCPIVGKRWKGTENTDAKLAWRLSFSLQEKEIVSKLPINLRGSLMLAKNDLETVREWWGKANFRALGVTSYFLKTILLKRMEKLPTRPDWEPVSMDFMYKRILKSLKSAVKYGHLPHFFLPRANLAEGLEDNEKTELSEWCEKTLNKLKQRPSVETKSRKSLKSKGQQKQTGKPSME